MTNKYTGSCQELEPARVTLADLQQTLGGLVKSHEVALLASSLTRIAPCLES